MPLTHTLPLLSSPPLCLMSYDCASSAMAGWLALLWVLLSLSLSAFSRPARMIAGAQPELPSTVLVTSSSRRPLQPLQQPRLYSPFYLFYRFTLIFSCCCSSPPRSIVCPFFLSFFLLSLFLYHIPIARNLPSSSCCYCCSCS